MTWEIQEKGYLDQGQGPWEDGKIKAREKLSTFPDRELRVPGGNAVGGGKMTEAGTQVGT